METRTKIRNLIMLILQFVALLFLFICEIPKANNSLPHAITAITLCFSTSATLCAIICFIVDFFIGE